VTNPEPDRTTPPLVDLIATDIDGTMLRRDGTLSPRVHDALHHANAAGIHVVPATGRPLMVSEDVIEALELNNYWVFANGAVTRHLDRDELIRAYWMDPTVAQGIVVEMRAAYPDCGFAIELEHGLSHEPGFADRVPMPPPNQPIGDVLDGIHGRVQKVLVYHDRLSIDELYQAACAVVGDEAVPCYSGLRFIEVAARLVTKATALDELCRDLGVDPRAVAAFGDNHNDVAMLEWAGRSYAMGNASDDAKAAAGQVIGTSDEDALAVAVEQLIAERSR
jgi:Cof subfamily protein (haloacid dehalogenase superfamily)